MTGRSNDETQIVAAINVALRAGWAPGTFAFGPPGRRPMVRIERAIGWRADGRLLVAVHGAWPHYCPARDCRMTYALDEPDWAQMLEALTSREYIPRDAPVLRGGRLA
ncbi:MAG: hypothetical protein KGK07_16285 [Chloroflexota bacterium]|nr:hypothetical protein [Chloroflexota bacterium]